MFRRQHAVPFEFDTVEPPDVEDCIEIDTSSPRTRRSTKFTEQDTESQRFAIGHLDARQHEATADDGYCCDRQDGPPRRAPVLDDHVNDLSSSNGAPSASRGQEIPKRVSMAVRKAPSQAWSADANVAATMKLLPHQQPTNAGPAQLTNMLRLSGRAADSTGSCCTSIDIESNDRQRDCSTTPTSIQASSIDGDVFDDAASNASDSSSDVPTDVATFFDHAGEANVCRERMSEHWFAICERIAAENAPPDAEASRPTKAEEATMRLLQTALDNAGQNAAKSRAVCLAQGINPDAFRYRRMSDTSS